MARDPAGRYPPNGPCRPKNNESRDTSGVRVSANPPPASNFRSLRLLFLPCALFDALSRRPQGLCGNPAGFHRIKHPIAGHRRRGTRRSDRSHASRSKASRTTERAAAFATTCGPRPASRSTRSRIREDVETLYRLGSIRHRRRGSRVLNPGRHRQRHLRARAEQPLIIPRSRSSATGRSATSNCWLAIPLYAGGPRDDFLLEQGEMVRIQGSLPGRRAITWPRSRSMSRGSKDSGILIVQNRRGPQSPHQGDRVRRQPGDSRQGTLDSRSPPSPTSRSFSAKGSSNPTRLAGRRGQVSTGSTRTTASWMSAWTRPNPAFSPDNTEAKLVFVIEEGRRYRLRDVIVRANAADRRTHKRSSSTRAGAATFIAIRPGDDYTKPLIERSLRGARPAESYRAHGAHRQPRVTPREVQRRRKQPEVDMLLWPFPKASPVQPRAWSRSRETSSPRTRSSEASRAGSNPAARWTVSESRNLARLRLAGQHTSSGTSASRCRIPRVPGPGSTRDVLVEVTEKNTGSVNFGVGLSSDAGVFGDISLNQRNFDIADWPLSWREFTNGRAFRGAGQTMNISLAPGDEVSTYSFSIGEPHLFNTDISANFTTFYRNRFYSNYKEERLSAAFGLGRRLGDVWQIGATARAQKITQTDFSPQTAIEVFDDQRPGQCRRLSGRLSPAPRSTAYYRTKQRVQTHV